jgi:hypothetical protein
MSVVIEPTVSVTLDDSDWILANASANPTLDIDIQNCAARVAFDRAYGLEPELKINNFHRGADPSVFVRSTRYPTGSLIVRDEDRDHDLFVLAIGSDKEWTLVGFLTGAEAKQRGRLFSENGRPDCWMVAQSRLRPMAELVLP